MEYIYPNSFLVDSERKESVNDCRKLLKELKPEVVVKFFSDKVSYFIKIENAFIPWQTGGNESIRADIEIHI